MGRWEDGKENLGKSYGFIKRAGEWMSSEGSLWGEDCESEREKANRILDGLCMQTDERSSRLL
jgi:hypothetical protein